MAAARMLWPAAYTACGFLSRAHQAVPILMMIHVFSGIVVKRRTKSEEGEKGAVEAFCGGLAFNWPW